MQERYNFKLQGDELKSAIKAQEDEVVAKIKTKSQACVGVADLLSRLKESGKYELAVASSSGLRRIYACLETAGLNKFFDDDKIFSAVDSLPTPTSKPNPAVYLHAMEKLGAGVEECLTVEDSMSGLRAALGAKLKCLGYVGSTHTDGQKDEMARHLLASGAVDILWDWADYEKHLARAENRLG